MYDLKTVEQAPTDLATPLVFEKVRIPLVRLIEAAEANRRPIAGRRFVDCVIHGPAILGPSDTTRFERCNLGDVAGDVGNLFLRAVGPMMVGVVSIDGCVFEGCIFVGVGFAGNDAFVDAFTTLLTPKKA